jgi:uncharacterized protein
MTWYEAVMAQRLVQHAATVPLRDDGTLRLAVVADTHSEPHRDTHAHLRALRPDAILHAGDIGDLAVIEKLREIAPVHVIRGNIDTRARDLPDLLTLHAGALRILIMHIAVAGPRLRADAAKHAREQKANMVVCGHSHVPFIGQERGITVFNPGSCGPRRFSLPIVFGTIDIGPRGIKLAHVDCETGQPWSPP